MIITNGVEAPADGASKYRGGDVAARVDAARSPVGRRSSTRRREGITKRRSLAIGAGLCLALAMVMPAAAITNDYERDFDHPYVGLVTIFTDQLWTRCTGELIAPTVLLTAGHCVALDGMLPDDAPASALVWFQQDAGVHLDPVTGAADPYTGYPDGCAVGTLGVMCATASTMYDYGFSDVNSHADSHDVGLVILDQPIALPEYATLPAAGALDALATARGTQDVTFTVSGYGWSAVTQTGDIVSFRERLMATALLTSLRDALIDGYGVRINGEGLDRGGTCFADSGGPTLWPPDSNQVVAIHSFGSKLCRGVDGEYRLDQQPVIDWILEKAGAAAGRITVG